MGLINTIPVFSTHAHPRIKFSTLRDGQKKNTVPYLSIEILVVEGSGMLMSCFEKTSGGQ